MALLDKEVREAYLAELGYASVIDFQRAVMWPKWVDGVYGPQTDNALRTAINVKRNCKDFSVKEFRCECGGRYCSGYPDYMKPSELIHIQTIRDHYGRPITITSGLRCAGWNRHLNGSVVNSGHLSGLALDFYQEGVTETVSQRRASMMYIRRLPNHKFSYGANMVDTNGTYRSATYMGNAMHTECNNTDSSQPDGKLNVDGIGGGVTVVAMQKFFGMKVWDGVISGQNIKLGRLYPSLTAVAYGVGGSDTIKALQKWLGVPADGVIGEQTVRAWQKRLGVKIDGVFGAESMKAWQRFLNENQK